MRKSWIGWLLLLTFALTGCKTIPQDLSSSSGESNEENLESSVIMTTENLETTIKDSTETTASDSSNPTENPSSSTTTTRPPDNIFTQAISNRLTGNFKTDPLKATGELYAETYRPQVHYSAKTGWFNDPNGLVYYEGEWHLFYQHNPTSNMFGYCYWGHAVSKDLVHWEELPVAISPTEKYQIWSGSAVVDEHDTSGFFGGGSGLVAIFTYADRASNQSMGIAYSSDKGRTWTRVAKPVLYTDGDKAFRDPKVFWNEAIGKWTAIIAGGQVRFYSSPNLRDWTLESRSDIWTECPDFFPLKVEDTNETLWVLNLAGEGYVVGTFDGKRFSPIQEQVKYAVSPDRYAGQTFYNAPDGRRVEINWMGNWKYANDFATLLPGNGVMTLPVELKLVKEDGKYRLLRIPVKEIDTLRGEQVFSCQSGYLKEGAKNPFDGIEAKTLDIQMKFKPAGQEKLGFRFRAGSGQEVVVGYDAGSGLLYLDRGKTVTKIKDFSRQYSASVKPDADGFVELRIILDWSGLEVFANQGEALISALIIPDKDAQKVEMFAQGGTAQIVSADAYRLVSIH